MPSLLLKRIKDWATSITAFRTGDVIPVDGPSGTAKMTKDNLLARTAENTLGSIRSLSNTATGFASDDYVVVDGDANGSRKMSKDTLLEKTAQNAFNSIKEENYFATKQNLEAETSRAIGRENYIESLFSAPTAEAVAAWLEAHPEATTTVQDRSLTNKKLVIGTLNFVTPEMFGAVGDGVNDDTAAIQQAVDSCGIVVFTNKTYKVSVPSSNGAAITLNDNQILLLNNAVLKLEPNNFEAYKVISASNKVNIKIIGGRIVGDFDVHTGSTGEYGHGIRIASQNVLVRDCEVENCWGDGIVVTGGASCVLVENCHIHNNRRQGLTIGNSEQIKIKDCLIHDIGGTDPGAAIDIEPNAGEAASNIVIDGCEEYDNVRGFDLFRNSETVSISGVKFVNCKSSSIFRCWGAENVSVQGCFLNAVFIARGTKNFKAVNCNLAFINFERSTDAVFKGCNIECNVTRQAVVYFYVDGPTGSMASVGFYDCNVSTTSASSIFRGGTSKNLVDELVISNCKIINKSNSSVYFLQYLPKKLFIKNSSIEGFSGEYGNFFSIAQDVIVRISDSVIDNAASVTFFLSYSGNVDIVITNTAISKVSRFFRVAVNSAVTGMIKLIANIMSQTSLQDYDYTAGDGGSESLNKLALPSIFTNLT